MDAGENLTKDKRRRNVALPVAMVTSFLVTFSVSALNLAIPSIAMEFGSSATMIGYIVMAYMLCLVILAVPFGRVADLGGRKRILISGIIIYTMFTGLTIFAWSTEIIITLRVIQGVGAAMIQSTNLAILIGSYPSAQRGRVLGLSVMMTYIGLSVGPIFGGLLTHWLGWRSIFAVTTAIGVVVVFVAALGIKKEESNRDDPLRIKDFNLLGMILYMIMVFCMLYGFSIVSQSPRLGGPLIAMGVIVLVAFVKVELKAAKPVIEIRLFAHNRNYLFTNLATLFNYSATMAISYLLSIYLQVIMHYDAQVSGLILISQPVVMAILSPIFGRMSDSHSPFILASLGMGFCTAGLISYIFIGTGSPLYYIIITLVVVGCGFGIFSSPNSNAALSCVPPADYGVASSILASMRSIGQVASMAIINLIIGAHLGDAAFTDVPPDELVSAMRTEFIVFSVICAVGIILSLQRKQQATP